MGNLVESLPIIGRDRTTAIESAVIADEAALFGATTTGTSCCDVITAALAAPVNVIVGQIGTAGSTNYTYVVADVGNAGTFSPASGVQTTTGNATLSSTNANTVTWNSVAGHTYNVYRSASSGTPSGTGFIGTMTASSTGVLTFPDTGITATLNVPTVNTTGAMVPVGPVFGGAQIFPLAAPATVNTVGAATLTVAQMLSGIIVRTGSQVGGITDTTPTAAALVAALPGVKVGNFFTLFIRNTTGQTETLGAGSSVTLAAGNTNTTPTVNGHEYRAVFTNVTPGSEAVTIYSMGAPSAY